MYLTFDDGPIPDITPWVLSVLAEYKAKATFFCVGHNVEKYPEVYQQIRAGGHRVGNHTYHHLQGIKTGFSEYINDIQKASDLISTNLFRPPHGRLKPSQTKHLLSEMKFKIVMWDILSRDFDQNITPAQCLKNSVAHIRQGSIIVFHDSLKSHKNLKFALPEALKILTDKGFVFKNIP